jgi:hypothetical protein
MYSHSRYGSGTPSNHDEITAGINTVLNDLEEHKLRHATMSSHASSAHDAYHDDSHWYSAPSKATTSEMTTSSRSRTNKSSAVFSSRRSRRPSTVESESTERTEAPSRNEIPQQEFGAYHQTHQQGGNSTSFACEFDKYTGCTATFRLDEIQLWIDHTVQHFESVGLPMVCVCWYCDEWEEFNAVSQGLDERSNFQNRMLHISGHLWENNGRDSRPRRPDHWIVDHLWKKRAISKDVFKRESGRHEMPQIDGLLPAGQQSPLQLRRQYMNSRVPHDMAKEERRQKKHQGRKN